MTTDKLAKARAFASHLQSSRSVREEKWRELSTWLAPHRALFDGEDMAASGERRNRNAFTQMAQAAQMQQQQQMLEAQAAVQNAQGMANAAKTVNDIEQSQGA